MTRFMRILALVTVRRQRVAHTQKLLSLESCTSDQDYNCISNNALRSMSQTYSNRVEMLDWQDMRDYIEFLHAVKERKTTLKDSEAYALAFSALKLVTGKGQSALGNAPPVRRSNRSNGPTCNLTQKTNRISTSMIDPASLAASEVDRMLLDLLAQEPHVSLEFLPNLLLAYEALGCSPSDRAQHCVADTLERALDQWCSPRPDTFPVFEHRPQQLLYQGDRRTEGPGHLSRASWVGTHKCEGEEPRPSLIQSLCPDFTSRLARSTTASGSRSPHLWAAIGRLAAFHTHVLPLDELVVILSASVSAAGGSGGIHHAALIESISHRLHGHPLAGVRSSRGDSSLSSSSQPPMASGDVSALSPNGLATLTHALAEARHANPRLICILTDEIGRRLGISPSPSVGRRLHVANMEVLTGIL